MLDVDQVYIAHYEPLVVRKERLVNTLPFKVEWVEDEPSDKYWTEDKETWEKKTLPYTEHRALKKSEISIAHKHIEIYKRIVSNQNKISLILEDDIVLDHNFVSLFNSFIKKTPKDWDMIFIGSGCNLKIPQNQLVPDRIA